VFEIIKSKEGKTVWLQNPNQMTADNLNTVRQEIRRMLRNKKRQQMRDKINEVEINSKNKNIRDLYRARNKFKKGYQPRTW
jgi:RNA polymerase-interacting CarD/CdnL/TRCF family regulator